MFRSNKIDQVSIQSDKPVKQMTNSFLSLLLTVLHNYYEIQIYNECNQLLLNYLLLQFNKFNYYLFNKVYI
jgi:hypothetical protein